MAAKSSTAQKPCHDFSGMIKSRYLKGEHRSTGACKSVIEISYTVWDAERQESTGSLPLSLLLQLWVP
jgi:hypothetical protein